MGKKIAGYVVLPIIAVPLCAGLLSMFSSSRLGWFYSENGPVELGTALLFVLASVAAIVHIARNRERLPKTYRVLFGLFALTALFVGLEEMSYGQHLAGFGSPEWFETNNAKNEVNLHNLYGNKPSRLIRAVGSIVIPVFCVVLPLLYLRRREDWTPGHWQHYLLPRWELFALVIMAQVATLPNKLPEDIVGKWWRLGELKELYWAIAAFCYIRLMDFRQREWRHGETAVAGEVSEPREVRAAA